MNKKGVNAGAVVGFILIVLAFVCLVRFFIIL